MEVKKTLLSGCYYFNLKAFSDKRGFFNEIFHQNKYNRYIKKKFVQTNYSYSKKNVFRGIHFQIKKPQGKLLTVISGKIKDIVIDLRKKSSTFGKVVCIILSEKKNQQVWIPPGFGHGFLTLTDNVKIVYQCTSFYRPKYERTLSFKDKKFRKIIKKNNLIISKKDKNGFTFEDLNEVI
jgi:dTDP-4-dehydrorhamnose 3,5-epimerase